MSRIIDKNKQPFLYVIENIDKVNIDEILKPTLIETLNLLENYFEKNDLLDARDYGKFFDDYLLGEGKTSIHFVPSSPDKRHDNYNRNTKNIEIIDWKKEMGMEYKMDIHTFLHEFIHFLVHRDSKEFKSDTLFDEGFAEKLTQDIMGSSRDDTYKDNINIVEFISLMEGKKDVYTKFLQGYDLSKEFLNNNKVYMNDFWALHVFKNMPEKIEPKLSDDVLRSTIDEYRIKTQRDLINSFQIKECKNVQDFLNIAKVLSQRPYLDTEFMEEYYDKYKLKLLENYKETTELSPEEQQEVLNNLDKIVQLVESYDRYDCEEMCRLNIGNEDNPFEICVDKKGQILKKDSLSDKNGYVFGGYNKLLNNYCYRAKNEDGSFRLDLSQEDFENLDFTKVKEEYQLEMDSVMEYFSQIEKSIIQDNHESKENTEYIEENENDENIIDNKSICYYDTHELSYQLGEKYEYDKDKIKDKATKIFTDGLEGKSKELAEIYSELFSGQSGIEPGLYGELQNQIEEQGYGDKFSQPTKIIRQGDNKYLVIFENDNGEKIGVDYSPKQNQEDKKQMNIIEGKLLETTENIYSSPTESITYEQMEMQVVKHNIEKSMDDGKVSGILEIKDEKMLQYLSDKNNLQKYLANPQYDKSRVFLVSKQDKEGNTFYEFVSHDGKDSYTKLDGMQEVQDKQENIFVKNIKTSTNLDIAQDVNAQFIDENGNSYFVYNQFGNSQMNIATCEKGKEQEPKSIVESNDYGINTQLHNSRVNTLIRNGYKAMGVGVEEVKKVYSRFKTQQREMEEKSME